MSLHLYKSLFSFFQYCLQVDEIYNCVHEETNKKDTDLGQNSKVKLVTVNDKDWSISWEIGIQEREASM